MVHVPSASVAPAAGRRRGAAQQQLRARDRAARLFDDDDSPVCLGDHRCCAHDAHNYGANGA